MRNISFRQFMCNPVTMRSEHIATGFHSLETFKFRAQKARVRSPTSPTQMIFNDGGVSLDRR